MKSKNNSLNHLCRITSDTPKLLILVFCIFFQNCTNIERVDTTQVKELVNNGEIKRITPTEITNTTNRLGKLLADSLDKTFLSQKSIQCDIDANDFVKNFNNEYGIKIRLLGLRDTTSKVLFSKELEVIQAYAYNAAKGLTIEPNVQKMGDSLLIYTTATSKKLRFAKQCLGDTEGGLSVWSLVFPKAQIIKRIE